MLRNGKNYEAGPSSDGFSDGAQIAFGLDGVNSYQHFIATRHGGTGNEHSAMDFYISDRTTATNTVLSGSTHVMTLNPNGVGIGTTNPSNTLTINGTAADTVPILGLRSGNSNVAFNNGAQIAFGYDGTDGYQHFIHTRHNLSLIHI